MLTKHPLLIKGSSLRGAPLTRGRSQSRLMGLRLEGSEDL